MQNKVQLIAYADRLGGGTLADLGTLLRGPLRGLFAGVHILPFFLPVDGADAGFDPIDHSAVDPKVGSWGDVAAVAREFDVMADVIVNHISVESPQFRDYSLRGERSAYRRLFLTQQDVFPNGARKEELAKIYRPRPGLPFTEIVIGNGQRCTFWTTFTPQQIDINVRSSEGKAYLERVLSRLKDAGVRMVRLDAVGYAIKKGGTSCFMIPETFEFIDELSAKAKALGIEVLVEVHSHYRRQIEIASRIDWVYDFALPPLVLHAFAFRTARYLKEWVQIRPRNAVTVLDTHDGIGIIDVGDDTTEHDRKPGLVPAKELDDLVGLIHRRTDGQSRLATGAAASNLDLYQVNSTFYDAMGRSDHEYLLARAIQFFLPGIPQVYYVGLLAGGNDIDLLEHTGVGRDINRHYYSRDEVERDIQKPVVQQLISLIRLRNTHSAFSGRFEMDESGGDELVLRWSNSSHFADLTVDFARGKGKLRYSIAPNGDEPTDTTRTLLIEANAPLIM